MQAARVHQVHVSLEAVAVAVRRVLFARPAWPEDRGANARETPLPAHAHQPRGGGCRQPRAPLLNFPARPARFYHRDVALAAHQVGCWEGEWDDVFEQRRFRGRGVSVRTRSGCSFEIVRASLAEK